MPKEMRMRVGTKVYLDSFAGPLPGVVVGFCYDPMDRQVLPLVKLTIRKRRGGYRPGEIIVGWPLHIFPRESLHVRSGHYYFYGVKWVLPKPTKDMPICGRIYT